MAYYKVGIEEALAVNNQLGLSGLYNNLGITKESLGDFDDARAAYTNALRAAALCKNEIIKPKIYLNLAQVHVSQGNFKLALYYFDITDSLAADLGITVGHFYTNFGRAALFNQTKEYEKALAALDKALPHAAELIDNLSAIAMKAELYERMGNYKLAFQFSKEYHLGMN